MMSFLEELTWVGDVCDSDELVVVFLTGDS